MKVHCVLQDGTATLCHKWQQHTFSHTHNYSHRPFTCHLRVTDTRTDEQNRTGYVQVYRSS